MSTSRRLQSRPPQPQTRIDIPPAFAALFKPARYKVFYGGRGGAKSWAFARALIALTHRKKLRVLCARELQKSIKESVHKLIGDQINALGLAQWYDITNTAITSRVTGSEFIFSGIRTNITEVKSMEGIDICWVEEAQRVSEESWAVLVPTVRASRSEIWISFNPDQETDPTYRRFVLKPMPGAVVQKVSWSDNPWFTKELRAEMEHLYRVDPDAAAWVWGGETRAMSDSQVLRGKWVVEYFEGGGDGWDGPYFGADWGFAQDPTAGVKLWLHDGDLHIEHEAYSIGCDIDKTAALFDRCLPGARAYVMRGDNSRPETISYLQAHGYPRMMAADKWSGSVEDGIAYLRQYKRIVIHPRCTYAAQEARLYAYKTDRMTGDVLPEVIDRHNHIIDAIRYALAPLIKRGTTGMLDYYATLSKDKAAEDKAKMMALVGKGTVKTPLDWHVGKDG